MAGRGIQQIRYAPLSAQMVDSLRNEIIEGKIKPGETLTEDGLAQNYGVSRVVVREALQAMENEGLVVKERNKKTQVVCFDSDDIAELFEVRVYLEYCAMESIHNKKVNALPVLREKSDSFKQSYSGKLQLREFVLSDIMFHRTMIELADNRRLLTMWDHIQSQLLTLLHCFAQGQSAEFLRTKMANDHDPILAAFESGDLRNQCEVLRVHIMDSIDYLCEYYQH